MAYLYTIIYANLEKANKLSFYEKTSLLSSNQIDMAICLLL